MVSSDRMWHVSREMREGAYQGWEGGGRNRTGRDKRFGNDWRTACSTFHKALRSSLSGFHKREHVKKSETTTPLELRPLFTSAELFHKPHDFT